MAHLGVQNKEAAMKLQIAEQQALASEFLHKEGDDASMWCLRSPTRFVDFHGRHFQI
jgi:hypothetical protein